MVRLVRQPCPGGSLRRSRTLRCGIGHPLHHALSTRCVRTDRHARLPVRPAATSPQDTASVQRWHSLHPDLRRYCNIAAHRRGPWGQENPSDQWLRKRIAPAWAGAISRLQTSCQRPSCPLKLRNSRSFIAFSRMAASFWTACARLLRTPSALPARAAITAAR